MQSPITGKEMKLLIRESTLAIRKESFPVMYHAWYCEDSGEEFEDPNMMETNLRQAADQYRSKYNLPFPEEIREIREQYGISAAKMSEVLRFGINQYKQYEHGELPSESNASLIFLAHHPKGFCQLVEYSSLEEEEKKELIKKADDILDKNVHWREKEWTTQLLMGSPRPDVERGFRQPNPYRMSAMTRYFADVMPVFKTQMNKMLFYADFVHFKRHGRSISGAKYRAIEMGPVPNNFDGLFQFAENEGFVRIEHHEYPNGSIGSKFLPGELPDVSKYLSPSEINTLKDVSERFKGVRSQEIIQVSHEEDAWLKNAASRSLINYLEAYRLKAM
ncbi:MAG TPA: DNA-binding protein [Saprospirales bacterium]|nr:DNA-binding protein [Saprospirales bacterium]